MTTQKEKIEQAKQSIEITEAMNAISDDEIQLTLKEEQHIIDSTETDEEAQELREAAILAKKSKLATQRAKSMVNKSVPAEKLFHRPSFGNISATATYHTRHAYRFLLGRNASLTVKDGKRIRPTRIVGLLSAAASVRRIEEGHQAGCFYATWTLVKIEQQLSELRALFKQSQQQAQELINRSTNLVFEPFVSRSPTTVTLDFRSSYAFHFSDVLTQYDELLRSVMPYRLHSIINGEQYRFIETRMGTPLRELFFLTDTWEFVGREAVLTRGAKLQDVEHRFGVLPDDILSGKVQPKIAKPSSFASEYLYGGDDEQVHGGGNE